VCGRGGGEKASNSERREMILTGLYIVQERLPIWFFFEHISLFHLSCKIIIGGTFFLIQVKEGEISE
jgi:hypothetical protein